MHLHGLRLRIGLLVAAVVLVSLGVAFFAIYGRTSSELSQRSNEDIQSDMEALEQVLRTGPAEPAAIAQRARAFLAGEPFRATTHIVFVDTPGAPIVTNQPGLVAEARRAPLGKTTRNIPGAGRFTLLVRDARDDGIVTRVGVGEPTAVTDRAKDAVSTAFLLAGLLAGIAALVGGAVVASRVAAPLRRMAGVASRVDAGDLGPRMDIHNRHDEVGVLAESFDHMLDRLQHAFDRQSAFVADASHELRTPLTVIRGQLEVLALDPDPDPEEIRRVERLVRTEIARMDRLVDDLLLLAQADDAGFLRRTTFALEPFLADLIEGLASTADRHLELATVPVVDITADEDRLAQALRNLLRNASEHTAAGGHIRLEVQRSEGRLQFVVDDDGPGIPDAQRDAVFDRFHRAEPDRAHSAGGAGLGLSIVQAIAEAHGGRALAERSPLGGARLVIEVPFAG